MYIIHIMFTFTSLLPLSLISTLLYCILQTHTVYIQCCTFHESPCLALSLFDQSINTLEKFFFFFFLETVKTNTSSRAFLLSLLWSVRQVIIDTSYLFFLIYSIAYRFSTFHPRPRPTRTLLPSTEAPNGP